MDEHLDAVVAHEAHGVEGIGQGGHGAVKGGVHGVARRLDAAARAQDGGGKGLVRQLFQRQHLAVDGGQHRLFLAGKLGVGGLCAAEQLIKKAHGNPSFHLLLSLTLSYPPRKNKGRGAQNCRAAFGVLHRDAVTEWTAGPPRLPSGWPSWWRCAPRCGYRRIFPRSRTWPCPPARPAGRWRGRRRSGWWANP